MPREFPRTRRVGEQLQRELAVLIRDNLRDPRLGMISVSAVDVSRDLSHANVYVSCLTENAKDSGYVDVLQGAAGFLRRELGQRLRMRAVPQLHFRHDQSLEEGARMSALIDSVVKEPDESGPDDDR